MQPSVLQLSEYHFTQIHVAIRADGTKPEHGTFDFQGVSIQERIQWGEAVAEPANDAAQAFTAYGLKLFIGIDNLEGKKIPYDIAIEVQGLFAIANEFERERHESLLIVNGSAILYSVIREQILTLTARSLYGQVMLPTVNFQDHKPQAAPAAPPT